MQEAEDLLLSRVRYHAQSNMKQWHSHSCSWCQLVPLHNHSLKVPNSNTNGKSLFFFIFSKTGQSHTQPILGIHLLTRWLHGNSRVRGREVVTGLLLHRVFLVAFFFFNWIWWLLQERGGVKNCILSDIDSLMVLKTRMVKFALSRQNTLPNRH